MGTSKKDEPFAGFALAPTSPNAPSDPNVAAAELGKAEAFKQLSSKIIELENKLSIAIKREVNFVWASFGVTKSTLSIITNCRILLANFSSYKLVLVFCP